MWTEADVSYEVMTLIYFYGTDIVMIIVSTVQCSTYLSAQAYPSCKPDKEILSRTYGMHYITLCQ